MSFSPDASKDWKNFTMSPGPEDSGRIKMENNQLKLQIKQLTADLQTEQGSLNYTIIITLKTVSISDIKLWHKR